MPVVLPLCINGLYNLFGMLYVFLQYSHNASMMCTIYLVSCIDTAMYHATAFFDYLNRTTITNFYPVLDSKSSHFISGRTCASSLQGRVRIYTVEKYLQGVGQILNNDRVLAVNSSLLQSPRPVCGSYVTVLNALFLSLGSCW